METVRRWKTFKLVDTRNGGWRHVGSVQALCKTDAMRLVKEWITREPWIIVVDVHEVLW